MTGSLAGKLVLISGAGSGIGRAACRILGSRDGAIIIGVDCNLEAAQKTIADMPKPSKAFHMDVSSPDSINRTLNEIISIYKKPPSVVVNAAGITKDNFLLKMSEADFDAVINVNLKGTFLVMQCFAKAMVEHELSGGSIINLSSIIGKYGNIGQTNYAASKAGVEAMTRCASKEFGKFQIRVNAILPGFIDTPMTEIVPEKIKDMLVQQCALRRFGQPEEVAEVIAFLASDKSSYINGSSIEVTGGF